MAPVRHLRSAQGGICRDGLRGLAHDALDLRSELGQRIFEEEAVKFIQIGNDEKSGQKTFVNLEDVAYIDINLKSWGRRYHRLSRAQNGLAEVIANVYEGEHGFKEILEMLGEK